MTQMQLIHLLGPESFSPGEDPGRLDVLVKLTQLLETAGFSAMIFPEANDPDAISNGKPFLPCEPLTCCGALAPLSKHIGLVASISSAYSQPYNVARRLASLDHISRGRIGWAAFEEVEMFSARYGGRGASDQRAPRGRMREFVDVVHALWDSWSAEAIDVADGGRAVVAGSKIRAVGHAGNFYRVKGPLDTPRPPQGRPVLFQAVRPDDNMDVTARFADVVIPAMTDRQQLMGFQDEFNMLLSANGRSRSDVKICPLVQPVISARERDQPKLNSGLQIVGDARWIGEHLSDWFRDGEVDGFCVTGSDTDQFAIQVTPLLRNLGILRGAPSRKFLRDNMDLQVDLER